MLLQRHAPPDQAALHAITNAIHAALEYSPQRTAPSESQRDVYAYLAREIEQRFWKDVYVERPEVREIVFTLHTRRMVLITGERGTGKSTALAALVEELKDPGAWPHLSSGDRTSTPSFIPYVFNANEYIAKLRDDAEVSETIHNHMYDFFRARIDDRSAWMSYLYDNHSAFEALSMMLTIKGMKSPISRRGLADDDDFGPLIQEGIAAFAGAPASERLQTLLRFIAEYMREEPLLIIDNVDHLANDRLVQSCGVVLSSIMASPGHQRLRGAIAVRPENAETLKRVLDTDMPPIEVSMMQRQLTPTGEDEPSIDVTLSFLRKRIAVLREPQTRKVILEAIDPAVAARLAEATGVAADGVDDFLGSVLELLDVLIFDVFAVDDAAEYRDDERDLVRAVHMWHNGSLRECAFFLTMFASDILQDKTHTYRLGELLRLYLSIRQRGESNVRWRLLRVTRSLLYRQLLMSSAPPGSERPLDNVMVFSDREEATDPPIHFLRLRILQYLAYQARGRAVISKVRRDIGKLGVGEERIDEALSELAVKRTHDDGGLIRIDGLHDASAGAPLDPEAAVQLLDAGRFLIKHLYITAEYLFWSAMTTQNANREVRLPATVTPRDIQSDEFRVEIAVRFIEHHLMEKFCDEHPFLPTFTREWPPDRARQRLTLYKQLFGFTEGDWFLNRAAKSIEAFMRPRDRAPGFAEARAGLARLGRLAGLLDDTMKRARSG